MERASLRPNIIVFSSGPFFEKNPTPFLMLSKSPA
jgi:hypothetical protein